MWISINIDKIFMDSCGFSLCQRKQRLNQPCPKHAPTLLSHFCAHNSCLQMLCTDCLKQHQENHTQMKTSPRICGLVQLEKYYQVITEKELAYEKGKQERQKGKKIEKKVDPCEVMCQFVDEYFYGSTQNKVANLKARKEALEKTNAKHLIDIVERSSHYKIEDNFKEKYFKFLDSLFSTVTP